MVALHFHILYTRFKDSSGRLCRNFRYPVATPSLTYQVKQLSLGRVVETCQRTNVFVPRLRIKGQAQRPDGVVLRIIGYYL